MTSPASPGLDPGPGHSVPGIIARATESQRRAADPRLSAFVSANAGSGKTKVLVDRVLRLLLDGAAPGKILCLTYTKAAAANMSLRVFARLAAWVALDDAALSLEIEELEGRPPGRAKLAEARRLFARAVETPGGLKIETIHAFCERILHLVPFEANVPARFEVLDEAASEAILAEATSAVLTEAAVGSSEFSGALERASIAAAGDHFTAALREALARRAFLRDRNPGRLGMALDALGAALGLNPGEDLASIEFAMLEGGIPPAEWRLIAGTLAGGQKNDQKRAADLDLAIEAQDPAGRLDAYLGVFLTDKGTPRADRAFVTGAIEAGLIQRLREERDRIAALLDRRRAAQTVARTEALLVLAAGIARRVEAIKVRRGALDFDDLIDKTRTLLMRSEAAAWVLHKLDAGIDHVLVDEAQDTNRTQWDILRALTAEFTAGSGARSGLIRTIFAVGDPKQSIYGFQGAEPRAFAENRRHFEQRVHEAGETFENVALRASFRSTSAVLQTVDTVFSVGDHFAGLSFEEDAGAKPGTVHETSRAGARGRVEIWPPVEPQPEDDPDAWTLPVDEPETGAPAVLLAERIARRIARLVGGADPHHPRIAPGEILVLVRKRGALFEAVIRALKQAHLPVAGADRLELGSHIAVMDLVAAGRAALLPEDDLTLAAALKSPLVGLDDEALIRIAARRGEDVSLADALAAAAGSGDAGADAGRQALARWRDLAGRFGPFGFYATILGPLGGRRALVERLGAEAGDAIDEFLALALADERRTTPSLAGFLARFSDAAHDVKRDMDASRDEIRVMTVHGAKGLEAEAVIVADSCFYQERLPAVLDLPVRMADEAETIDMPVWLPPSDDRPAALAEPCRNLRERGREEHNRLLYVALTRAKDLLIVASYVGRTGAGEAARPHPASWHAMTVAALDAETFPPDGSDDPLSDALRVVTHGAAGSDRVPHAAGSGGRVAEPDWLRRPVPADPPVRPPIRPSRPNAAADVRFVRHEGFEETPDIAASRQFGVLVHALLERLPDLDPATRPVAAARYLAARAPRLAEAERLALAAQALTVLDHPALAALFGPGGRAEVPVAGRIDTPAGTARIDISGQIDRLAVTDGEVHVADFKTGAPGPGGPARAHVAQLALYRALLNRIYPAKTVRAFIVYTGATLVQEIAREALDAALAEVIRQQAFAGGWELARPEPARPLPACVEGRAGQPSESGP